MSVITLRQIAVALNHEAARCAALPVEQRPGVGHVLCFDGIAYPVARWHRHDVGPLAGTWHRPRRTTAWVRTYTLRIAARMDRCNCAACSGGSS